MREEERWVDLEGHREEVLEKKSTASRKRRGEKFTIYIYIYISKGHFFFLALPSPHFHKRVKKTDGQQAAFRPRKSGKDKKVKQKADYVTPGMKYGVGKGGVSGQTQ